MKRNYTEKDYADKNKLNPGDRVSFIYWGPHHFLKNKRFTGRVKSSPIGSNYISFYIFHEEYTALLPEEADNVVILNHNKQSSDESK